MTLYYFFDTRPPRKQLDKWSYVHFSGSFTLAACINLMFGWSPWWALFAGFVWECGDGGYKLYWTPKYDGLYISLFDKIDKLFDRKGAG